MRIFTQTGLLPFILLAGLFCQAQEPAAVDSMKKARANLGSTTGCSIASLSLPG